MLIYAETIVIQIDFNYIQMFPILLALIFVGLWFCLFQVTTICFPEVFLVTVFLNNYSSAESKFFQNRFRLESNFHYTLQY